MVSLKLKFRASTIHGKEGSLYYQVIYKRTIRLISTGYKIFEEEWNADTETLIITTCNVNRANYLYSIEHKILYDRKRFQRILNSILEKKLSLNIDMLIAEYQRQSTSTTLFNYVKALIMRLEQQGQHRTGETYQSALRSFCKFRNYIDLSFEELDSKILMAYQYYLKAHQLSLNTISFYMKRLRAVYNRAVEDDLVQQSFPFKKVYTSTPKTAKRAIAIKYIKQLKAMDLSYSSSKSFARDMFLLSFYLRGMSFVDMAFLQKKDLNNGMLTYRRKKTGQKLTIQWESCMQDIVERYTTSFFSNYMLCIADKPDISRRKQYHNALTRINRNLKNIGQELGLTHPLTMNVARHSWASIARSEGIPISVISEGMGHNSERTTQIYLSSLETSVINKANRKILKLL